MVVYLIAKFLLVGSHRRGVKTSVVQIAGRKSGIKKGSRKAFMFWIASSKNQCRLLLCAVVYKTVFTDKLKLLITTVHRPAALRQKSKIT
jgi:hypothetical protein